jgi:photosystem II stability/assembly factor-like uncharacterized protein
MRTLKISLLVFIISVTLSAQWYQQNSGTSNTFYFVQFVTEQVGWAAAYSTTQVLFKTTNGGQVWQLQYNSQNPVFQLFFINENVGWMSTWTTGPLILKTIDGGENWMQVYSYPYAYEYIRDMEFINPATGWFVGEETISYGMITNYDNLEFPVLFKETTDGGATWVEKNFPPNYPGGLRQIEALDYMNLIVTGYDTLFKTTNGGVSWHKYPLPQFGDNKIQFINMNIGWSCMGGKLFKTIDGGEYWYQQVQPVNNFYFTTSQIGWYTYGNQIYNSTNGGNTWTPQNSNTITH